MVQHKVVGACAPATTMTRSGRVRQLFFKGQMLPADTPQVEIQHLLSVKLIAPVQPAPAPVLTPGEPPTGDPPVERDDGDADDATGEDDPEATAESGSSEGTTGEDPEVEAKRAEARAKLPTDGSKPDGRAGQAVWVEYLVSKGYDYTTLAKADKKELVELAGSLDQ